MAGNTNRIVIQLNQVAASAKQAEIALRNYEAQLKRINEAKTQIAQGLLTGKAGSPAELGLLSEQLISGNLPERVTSLTTGTRFRTTKIQQEFQKQVNALLNSIAKDTIDSVANTTPLVQQQFQLTGFRDKEIAALHKIEESYVRLSKSALGGAQVKPELLERYRAVIDEKTANIARLNKELDQIQKDIAKFAQSGQQVTTTTGQIAVSPTTAQNIQKATVTTGATKGPKPAFSEEELAQLTKEYDTLFQKANELGFTAKNLKTVFKDPTTGAQEFSFAMRDVNGVVQKTSLIMSRNGEVVTQTQKKFRTFGDTIVRNIREVAGWSVAIGLIYGSLYKLQDLVRLAIDNQSKLADVTIAMGNVTKDTSRVFESALKVAQQTGESLNGVIEAYSFAYRAVSQIADADKRTAAANQLLTESIILSKLSTLDQAEAIDALAGSLTQLRGPTETFVQSLDRGAELLDKWTYLSTRANVTLDTLAVGFSITAESGVNAFSDVSDGINYTNAAIAVLAEKIGALGAKETGNAVRAIISGFTSEKTRDELNKFGISVTDVSGNLRSWLDISKEISNLYRTGIISSQQLNQIAFAIGGGNRRGQQVAAYLSDIERVNTLAMEQADAAKVNGFAQQALGIKLETVQTSVTQLGNAFQGLAETLGESGGVLDSISLLVDLATKLVTAIDKVTASLGTLSVPTLVLLAQAGLSLASGKGGGFLGGFLGAGALGGLVGGAGKAGFGIGAVPGAVRNFAGVAGRTALTAGLVGATTALPYIQEGDYQKAGVALGGAIIGTIVTGGSPIGALIGTAIADSFVNGIGKHSDDIQDYILSPEKFKKAATEAGFPSQGPTALGDLAALYAKQNLISAGLGENVNPNLIATLLASPIVQNISGAFGINTAKQFQGLNKDEVLAILAGPEFQAAIRSSTPLTQNEVQIDQFTKLQQESFNSIKDSLNAFRTAQKDVLFKQYISGEGGVSLSAKDYTQRIESLNTFASTISSVITILKGNYGEVDQIVKDLLGNQQNLFETILNLSPEAQAEIANLIQNYKELLNLYQTAQEQGRANVVVNGVTTSVDDLKTQLNDAQTLIAGYLSRAREAQIIAQTTLPTTIQFPANKQYIGQVLQRANTLQAAYLDTLTPDERTKFLAENKYAENILEIITEGGKIAYDRLPPGVSREFFQKAFEQLQTEGVIPQQNPLGFQSFDITSQQFKNVILPQYQQLLSRLSQQGYQPDIQPLIQLFKDGKIETNTYDWKVIQYLLQENNDLQRKQLDGIYNLPANATFYVPLAAAEIDRATRNQLDQGAGGTLNTEALDSSAGHLTGSAQTLEEAGQLLREAGVKLGEFGKVQRLADENKLQGNKLAYAIDQIIGNPQYKQAPPQPYTYPSEGIAKGVSNRTAKYLLGGYGVSPLYEGPLPVPGGATIQQPINTQVTIPPITLNSTSNITLLINGQVLAQIIGQQLAQSISTQIGAGGSLTRRLFT